MIVSTLKRIKRKTDQKKKPPNGKSCNQMKSPATRYDGREKKIKLVANVILNEKWQRGREREREMCLARRKIFQTPT